MGLILGCIADDFTGATDMANMLVRQGMRTVVLLGEPQAGHAVPDTDAVVVALKSRTVQAAQAVAQSVAALRWLRDAGARQFFFKYCSTFDSTDAGNIGPVADALLDELGENFSVACPAYPENKRTIYQGYLFVGDLLLSESGMKDHPLTPMRDPSLVRVLSRQTTGRVGLVPWTVVRQGAGVVAARLQALREEGCRYAILDALGNEDLFALGEALTDMKLVTGGSGLGLPLPENYRRRGWLGPMREMHLPEVGGRTAVLSGSCSLATQAQVSHMKAWAPSFAVDVQALAEGRDVAAEALAWAASHLAAEPVLIYSTADAASVAGVQNRLGREAAGEMVEQAMARIACGLVSRGVRRLVVAGGETSGAVVGALGVSGLHVGAEIDPGVPWTQSVDEIEGATLQLALKSGNFGGEDFFAKAFRTRA